jgi:carboxymethylenebutenolidase
MEKVQFRSGSATLDALMARPPGAGASPAILLLPAIAGVNEYMEGVARRLADLGYAVLLLDYYARTGHAPDVSTPEKIGAAVAALSDPEVLDDVAAAVAWLRERDDVDGARIASFGFCIGGMYAFLAACRDLGLAAAVDYYGAIRYAATGPKKPVSPIDCVPKLAAPLLAHFGTFDRLISGEDIALFESALQAHHKSYELFLYRGAPHAFDEDFRPAVFRPVAARLAWQRSLAFLDWHLRGRATR